MSRRDYLSIDELELYANIEVTDETEGLERISIAEEMIDGYIGTQEKFMSYTYEGVATAVSGATIYDSSGDTQFNVDDDYFKGCELEIIGGTGAGQRGVITSSSRSNQSVTLATAFSTTPDTTSAFRIYQLGKFPRRKDVFHDSDTATPKYYKAIPEEVKRAVAAQVEFMIQMGDNYFSSNVSDLESETIGDYSYKRSNGGGSIGNLIAPKAKLMLRGFMRRIGRLVA